MSRATALLFAAGLALPVAAIAGDSKAEVCVLTSVETITAPKKPNIYETILDCGNEPSEAQSTAAKLVNNAMNEPDALEVMVRMGYEVESGTTWISYTGREILGRYVLVLEGEDNGEMTPPEAEPAPAPAAEELPEAEEGDLDEGEDESMGDDEGL